MKKYANNLFTQIPQITIRFFLVALISLLGVALTSTKLLGAAITTPNKAGLENAINGAGDATFAVEGVTFNNSYSTTVGSAVNITKPNKKLIGATDPKFTQNISNLVNGILYDSITAVNLDPLLARIDILVASLSQSQMSYIKGNGVLRTATGLLSTLEAVKWIRLDINSDANGFSMYNVRVGDVNISYMNTGNPVDYDEMEKSGVVNSFIGNNTKVVIDNSFDSFINNDFHDINITMTSQLNNFHTYLAGGGIIGLRSQEGSTIINNISGNLFRNISILTTNLANETFISGPFIQGGGIIGLDPSFKPANVNGN
ncbi:MAG: hypothetical protein LBF38_06380, partial [Deltaproteobacteria bacterium]|nr:hypothetical protein [Deltaproteobacteria bacterium]